MAGHLHPCHTDQHPKCLPPLLILKVVFVQGDLTSFNQVVDLTNPARSGAHLEWVNGCQVSRVLSCRQVHALSLGVDGPHLTYNEII